jgi:transcriptional regulator GlxA family with amidase domain
VSPFHLVRLFQKHLSLTPIAYLWQQRIAEGIKTLEQTGLPIGTIASQCGFQSRYHFSRRIRQETGSSPQEVRRRFWQQSTEGGGVIKKYS